MQTQSQEVHSRLEREKPQLSKFPSQRTRKGEGGGSESWEGMGEDGEEKAVEERDA